MPRIHRLFIRSAAILGLGLSIAACGSGNNGNSPPGGGGNTAKQEDQFGMAFATGFRANPNSEPFSPQDGDIVAISLTAEPVTIN